MSSTSDVVAEEMSPLNELAELQRDRARYVDTGEAISDRGESLPLRGSMLILAIVLMLCQLLILTSFWAPAEGGVDQNGYLVGGRQLAQTLTMRQSPQLIADSGDVGRREAIDPHGFVSSMWVGFDFGTPDERYYPKYPIGLPLLNAICWWIGEAIPTTQAGANPLGNDLAQLLSPALMSLASLGVFVLVRQVAGSFWALLMQLLFITSPLFMTLGVTATSHASTVCLAAWGMAMLLRWVRVGTWWRAILAGGLLGYAATIRYTEVMLWFPLTAALLWRMQGTRWREWRSGVILALSWLLPVLALVTYNKIAFGYLTGYATTNESEGFGLRFAVDNWLTLVQNMQVGGMSLTFPLALVGLVVMFWRRPMLASVLALWILPNLIVYISYYWAPDNIRSGYLRFFSSVVPGLFATAAWGAHELTRLPHPAATRRLWVGRGVAWGSAIVVGGAITFSLLSMARKATAASDDATPMLELSAMYDAPAERSVAVVCLVLLGVAAGAAAGAASAAAFRGARGGFVLAGALVVVVAAATQLQASLDNQLGDQPRKLILADTSDWLLRTIPAGSVVFSGDNQLLNSMQFVGDYKLYQTDLFERGTIESWPNRFNGLSADDANPQDRPRLEAKFKVLGTFDQNALDERARAIINGALSQGRRVLFVQTLNENELRRFYREPDGRVIRGWPERIAGKDRFKTSVISTWQYSNVMPVTPKPQANRRRWADPWPGVLNRPAVQVVELTRL